MQLLAAPVSYYALIFIFDSAITGKAVPILLPSSKTQIPLKCLLKLLLLLNLCNNYQDHIVWLVIEVPPPDIPEPPGLL